MEKILVTKQVVRDGDKTILKDINKEVAIHTIFGKDLMDDKNLCFKLIDFLNS